MSTVRCAAVGGTDVAEGRRLRNGQEADVDLTLPDNRAKVEAGLLLPLTDTDTAQKTVDEVLAWVGDDPDRAQEALSAEHASRRPRSTLIARLEELGSPPDDTTSKEGE